nr:hypothetical protein [Tanacetum cinerariifolium]
MSCLSDFEELNGGYVAFGGNPNGGKISRKGKIRTGKFDEKVDEGFLVGYAISSKAFRVFNSRTRIVQETLHKTNEDATFDGKEPDFDVKKPKSKVIISPRSSAQDLSVEFEDCSDNSINEVNAAGPLVHTVGQISSNSTNTFSAAGPSNADARPTYRKSSFIDVS